MKNTVPVQDRSTSHRAGPRRPHKLWSLTLLLLPFAALGEPAAEPPPLPEVMELVIGKSTMLRMPSAIQRISVGNPGVADVTLINPQEIYLLGKAVGATNLLVWRKDGGASAIDIAVNADAARLQSRINQMLPDEKGIKVSTAADSIILSGNVSSAHKAERAVTIAEAYVRNLNRSLVLPVMAGDGQVAAGTRINVGSGRSADQAVAAAGARVINLMNVDAPQQVMLEVKVAEVSKTLLDKLGAQFALSRTRGDWTYSILNNLLMGSGAGLLTAFKDVTNRIGIDAQTKDGLLKILAEPNIVAISGQEGSFLAGGKIFIPVARSDGASGLPVITLEEKEYGVGLKFTPTVLDGGRINLKVAPEVSELSQTGSPFTTIGEVTAVLPSFTVRRAQTTVQLKDGQSFVIAGLIKSNVAETVKRLPGLGELPVLGTLFRSSEFQNDQSELMFLITPRLVKPLPANPALPTDAFVPPSRGEFFLGGQLEGSAPPNEPSVLIEQPPARLPAPAEPATN